MPAVFTQIGELQAVAEMYQNDNHIADLILPRVRVNSTTYRFKRYPTESRFTLPQTLVGRMSTPRRIQDRWKEDSGVIKDYGLDHPIPMQDMRDARANGVDMRLSATNYLTQLVKLDREIRVANMVFDVANYASGLSATLGAGTQFSDASSSPLTVIGDALLEPLVRPNIMVLGVDSWKNLRRHPEIIEAIRGVSFGNAAQKGFVTNAQVADLFDLDRVLVGDARVNTAGVGLTPSYSRVFNDSCALLHINGSVASPLDQIVTWGYTVEFETIVAGQIEDADLGLHGGVRVRVGESVNEQLVAPSAGYLFLDTVG